MSTLYKFMFLLLFATLLACSGKSDENLCEGVTCERGVCNPGSGACTNPSSCLGDSQCVVGWRCEDAACVAATPCTDDEPCERGECVDGACVNPASCDSVTDCLPDYRCNAASQCVEDQCAGVDCPRGVCNPSTRTCVNRGVCTAGTQSTDCLAGHYCYGQSCELGDVICDDIDCARGVCDPAVAECVQPEQCNADVECLAGTYCGEGSCEVNQCDEQMRVCARGVCNPVDASCENAEQCDDARECLDGYACVGGECRISGDECAGECLGTQVCEYVPAMLEATCVEGERCFATTDCIDDRVCVNNTCGAGGACIDDAFEPNDDSASAVVITSLPGNFAAGSICQGDVDTFSFSTTDSPLLRGVLVVDLAIAALDVGGGTLQVEVERPDGTSVTAITDEEGVARLELMIGVLDGGAFEIRVTEDSVGLPGVKYGLFADLLDTPTIDACLGAEPLGQNTTTGNTSSGASYLLSASCEGSRNDAGENVYTFSVAEPSFIRLVVEPDAAEDLVVNVRRRCESGVPLACSNNAGSGGTEQIETFVPPGDYFVIVEGATTTSGGSYELSLIAQPVICLRGDASCIDEMTSQFCNGQGTGFEEVTCDTTCDAATGRCARLQRDACFTAIDASAGIVDSIEWETLTNDYDPGPNGCVPDSFGTQTDGPDAAYFIDLPPAHVIHAVQTLASGDRGSMYLVRDCENLSSCVTGVNASSGITEELIYFNTSATHEPLYLISDIEQDSFGYGIGNMRIDVLPTICTPGARRCMGADVAETCSTLGTAWDSAFCSFGCTGGSCALVTNSQCTTPVDLIANGPVTARIDEYTASYNPGFSGCTSRSASGPDAVYAVTPAAGEIALVQVTADFDVSLWASSDCSDMSGSCVAGSDAVGVNDETIEFAGDGVTTYYVVVDSQFNGSGIYTVSATLMQPTCTPGVALQCLDAMTLEYCTPLGVEAPYACATTCTNALCDQPLGQICPDPIVLGDGATFSGTMNVPNTINPGVGTSGACDFPSGEEPYGSDVIFAVDLLAGDFLFADYDMNSSFGIMYALSDCSDTDTCLARSTEGGRGTVVVEAQTSRRVYLVLDRTTTSVSSIAYTVDIDIRRQDCTIGTPAFCAGSDTVEYCDNLGFTRQYTCDGTCTGGLCDAPRGDECIDPIRVAAGDNVSGDWTTGDNNVQPRGPIDGWCEFDDNIVPTGPEDIYVIDLLPGDLLQATLTTSYGSAYHYVMEDCFDTSTCRDNNFDRGSGVVQYYSQFGGSAYVVVDASSTFNSSTTYTLQFDVSSGGLCAPGSSSCVAGTLTTCDEGGGSIASSRTCPAGCATEEACAPEQAADLCTSAPLTTGTSVYASFADLTNDVTISSSGCTGSAGGGSDLIYAVAAGPGDVIRASVKSWGLESVQVYLTSDCTDPTNACEVGARGDTTNFAEVFFAPTTFATYYVVAEATSSFSDEPFQLDVEVLQPECIPGDFQCAPSAASMLSCNQFGLWETYPCTGGCANNTCGMPTGQACFDAIPLADGDSASGAFDTANSINPGTGQVGGCNFGTQQANGADTIYAVDLAAGEVLDVAYTSSSSFGLIYLLSDCNDTSTCLANTDDGTSGSLQYSATADETIFVVIDRTSSGTTTLSYTLDVQVRTPNCTPGDAPTCSDANTLQYCDAFGFLETYSCGGAAGTCTNAACDTPTADICVDAGVLTDGATIIGDFLGTNDSSPGVGTYGACTFPTGDAPVGVDHFYRVDLLAGEWLIVNHTSATTSMITYLLGTCGDPNSCRAATAEGADGRLAYQATTAETLYFVVDRTTSSTSSLSWQLDVIIGTPSCTPGATQCGDATTLQWCNEFGFLEDWDCTTTCTAGACDAPSSEICADPIVLAGGASVTDDFGGSNAVNLGTGTVGLCDFGTSSQPGTDHFYRVDLQAGQTVTADWTSTSSFAIVYITRDCHDPDACLDNTGVGASGSVSFTATTAESVFVVVDRNLSGSTTSLGYTLDITVN